MHTSRSLATSQTVTTVYRNIRKLMSSIILEVICQGLCTGQHLPVLKVFHALQSIILGKIFNSQKSVKIK